MPTFNVRRAEIGLFDVDDDAKLREAFSTLTATQPVLIDDAALNIVADDLGLDAEGIALDAQRYVGGQYRQKAMGFSGGRLGDFGEILTYLLWRMDGKSIERVVDGVRPQDVPANARFTFPEPDYIVRTPTGAPGVLEVKSRELLKFQPLLQLHSRPAGQRGHRWLQPCDRVAECANEALSQLGSTVAPGHGLELRSGKRIPFPANYGVAVAVLMHDGRLAGLIGNGKRFKTPPPCRESVPARDCWACAGDGTVAADAVVVEMANRPDHLPLVPALEGDAGWFAAYRAWRQALWAGSPLPVSRRARILAERTRAWLESDAVPEEIRPAHLAYWDWTLRAAAHRRGFELTEPLELGADAERQAADYLPPLPGLDNWRVVTTGRFDDAIALTHEAIVARRATRVALDDGGGVGGAVIDVDVEQNLTLSLLPRAWPMAQAIDARTAIAVARDLIAIAARVLGNPLQMDGLGPLRPVIVRSEERELVVAWILEDWRPLRTLLWMRQYARPRPPNLFMPLLWILPDGRARLRLGQH